MVHPSKDAPEIKRWLSVARAAEHLDVSPATILRMTREGLLEAMNVSAGRKRTRLRISVSSLNMLISARIANCAKSNNIAK